MNKDYKKLSEYIESIDLEKRSEWEEKTPHFGGDQPHRYTVRIDELIDSASKELCCQYCGKPKRY